MTLDLALSLRDFGERRYATFYDIVDAGASFRNRGEEHFRIFLTHHRPVQRRMHDSLDPGTCGPGPRYREYGRSVVTCSALCILSFVLLANFWFRAQVDFGGLCFDDDPVHLPINHVAVATGTRA